jgi:hypothetical protein
VSRPPSFIDGLAIHTEDAKRRSELGSFETLTPGVGCHGKWSLGTALAICTLMPSDMNIDLALVLVVFIGATLLGFASHAPAGLGVFDATVLLGFGGECTEKLLAALLLFRFLYHLCPFLLALVIFLVTEWRSNLRASSELASSARLD